MNKILLHACCGPCLTSALHQLNQVEIKACWYNPNIEPEEEHQRRLESFLKLLKVKSIDQVAILYDYEIENRLWHDFVSGYEEEKEGGKRCDRCIEFRLKRVAEFLDNGEKLMTSLTVSPHKNAQIINLIGKKISSNYLESNFKEKNGYKISIELSKKYKLYRQNYCGCLYSKRKINR